MLPQSDPVCTTFGNPAAPIMSAKTIPFNTGPSISFLKLLATSSAASSLKLDRGSWTITLAVEDGMTMRTLIIVVIILIRMAMIIILIRMASASAVGTVILIRMTIIGIVTILINSHNHNYI